MFVYPNQRDAYLFALREALIARGVSVSEQAWGHGDVAKPYSPDLAIPILTIESQPLRDILPALEKPSQNQIAEILLQDPGARRKLASARPTAARVVIERQLPPGARSPMAIAIRDGSGLSRHDYLSPETIVRVLDKIRADTAFQVFYNALPIAGIDGSLEHRMQGTAGRRERARENRLRRECRARSPAT